jgi:ABC-2 type transport system permease protein
MNHLVRTELLKLRSTRTTAVLVAAGLAVATLLGFANASIAGGPAAPELGSAAFIEDVLGVSGIPAAVALLLGVLLSAGEHQHGTITTTFLVTPRRARIVAAKAVAAAIGGVALAVGMIAIAVGAAAPVVIAKGASIDAISADAALTVLGLLLAAALLGALGALLGLLIRSQVAAVVVVLAWALVLEGIITTLIGGELRRWLPGGASADLAGNGGQPLWTAALVVTAWTAVVAILATPAVIHRDIA